MAGRDDDIGDWIEAEATGGGLALLGWGFGSAVAVVLAFASWQYAAPLPSSRTDLSQPDPTEITGSIAASDRGQTSVAPTRGLGAGRFGPVPLGSDESVATSRDIEALRGELADIRRRISQIGMAGEGFSRRIDGLEARVNAPTAPEEATAAAARPADPGGAPLVRARVEPRTADRLPVPPPRPDFDVVHPPPVGAVDADGPATTGAVPRPPQPTERHDASESTVAKPSPGPEVAAKPSPSVEAAKPVVSGEAGAKAVATSVEAGAKAGSPADLAPKPSAPMDLTGKVAAADPAARPAGPTEFPGKPAKAPLPVPAAKPIDDAAAKAVRVVTARQADAPGAPPSEVAPDGPRAAIDLGGFRSLGSLRRAWSDTAGRHADLSKGLEPLARLRETDSGIEARLLAGPFADQTEAAKACLRLKAIGAPCTVTTYSGQPIGGLR